MAKMKTANATLPLLQHRSPPAKGTSASASPTKPKAYGAVDERSSVVSPTSSYGSTAASSPTRPRVASEELIVPHVEQVSSVYYGVDAFSPTLVDFYTLDQKRIVWSSRAHRKMMTTLYRAWNGQPWKLYSLSFWGGLFAATTYTLFLVGVVGEILAHRNEHSANVHALVDVPLLFGAVCFFICHVLSYLEVINSCHNLEAWLDEYFHGYEPVLQRRYLGYFPSRIDFWNALLGIGGSLLYVVARTFILFRADVESNYGVISISRKNAALVVGYWVPFFVGSFLLLLSAYLAHVEVVHRWFSWRLDRLESWVTGLTLLSATGFFLSSTLQFMDPMAVIFPFQMCITPFTLGCIFGLGSSVLSFMELESSHKRHKHPEYGLLKDSTGYGTWTA
ncbi:hypothetical protein PINS_up002429 [Pythium insidiosum]|nr:hypothetical protein PINS_up002429 [Pythium insidiosum]